MSCRGNMSMGRRRGRCVSMVVERSPERLLKLGVKRRGRRGVSRPVTMVHNLWRASPPNALIYTSVDIRRVRCWCRWYRWLSRPGRSTNGALSERLRLFRGGIMRSFRVRFERFPECLGLLRRGLWTRRAIWLRKGTG